MTAQGGKLNSVALQLNARKRSTFCPHCEEVVGTSTYNRHKKKFMDSSGQWMHQSQGERVKRRKTEEPTESSDASMEISSQSKSPAVLQTEVTEVTTHRTEVSV